jgi:hypothetical protein
MTEVNTLAQRHFASILLNGISNIKKTLKERSPAKLSYFLVSSRAVQMLKKQIIANDSSMKDDILKALREDVTINEHDNELPTSLNYPAPLAHPKRGVISQLYEPLEAGGISFLRNKLSDAEIPIIYRKLTYCPINSFSMIEPNFHVGENYLDYYLPACADL